MSEADDQPLTTHPDDTSILARWEQLGRPPIPIACNERGVVWKTIVDLAIYLSIPPVVEERQRAVERVLAQGSGAACDGRVLLPCPTDPAGDMLITLIRCCSRRRGCSNGNHPPRRGQVVVAGGELRAPGDNHAGWLPAGCRRVGDARGWSYPRRHNQRSQRFRNVGRDARVALSIISQDDPYDEATIRGRVVEVHGDPTLAFMDRVAQKYVSTPWPFRHTAQTSHVLVIEPDRASHRKLPFTHNPSG